MPLAGGLVYSTAWSAIETACKFFAAAWLIVLVEIVGWHSWAGVNCIGYKVDEDLTQLIEVQRQQDSGAHSFRDSVAFS